LNHKNYVLITAARNEEKFIEETIKTIIAQTVLPNRWIIVSDGSTDRTDEIVLQYSKKYNFITLLRKTTNIVGQVDFSSKVQAIKMGHEMLAGIEYDFIGILDGDVTFDSCYYENILNKFSKNAKLGIAGGVIYDKYNNNYIRRSPDFSKYVSGCVQLFRRECYEDIGGLIPIKEGGEDTVAVIMSLMKGWEVESFEDLNVSHHGYIKATRGKLSESFRNGKLFYFLGGHPFYEILKSIYRFGNKPFFLFGFTRMCGYIWPYCKRQRRPVSDDFVKYLRKEQLSRLKNKIMQRT
jgi:poly-beta-1,6-N-acetyl-D-glucosamine synthase